MKGSQSARVVGYFISSLTEPRGMVFAGGNIPVLGWKLAQQLPGTHAAMAQAVLQGLQTGQLPAPRSQAPMTHAMILNASQVPCSPCSCPSNTAALCRRSNCCVPIAGPSLGCLLPSCFANCQWEDASHRHCWCPANGCCCASVPTVATCQQSTPLRSCKVWSRPHPC